MDVTPEQVGFPWAAQAARLTREIQGRKPEIVLPLTRAPAERLSAREWLQLNRQGWGVEAIHQRLDASHNEDKSRVRDPKAMLLVGIFRRWSNSLGAHWRSHFRKPKDKTTTDFFKAMGADQRAPALRTLRSVKPTLKSAS